MVSKYPECDLCPTSDCNDEKIEMVLQDADFTKAFVNNMLASNIDEISKDCYFMSEVISEKTSPMEIADFAFCIYVQLSQLVEMPMDKRMEIGVLFRQEFDHLAEEVSKGREIAKKKASAPGAKAAAGPAKMAVAFEAKAIAGPAGTQPRAAPAQAPSGPIAPVKATPAPAPAAASARVISTPPASATVKPKPLPVPVKAIDNRIPDGKPAPKAATDDARKFLEELDQDIAEIEAISSTVEQLIQTDATPVIGTPSDAVESDAGAISTPGTLDLPPDRASRKGGGLEPVIGKLAGARPVASGASPAPATTSQNAFPKPREPERGSKANPIKLTPDMLAGVISEKDMARVEKGIKIKRVDSSKLAPKVAAPMQMRDGSMPVALAKPARLPDKIERIDRPTEKGKALGEELFTAFQQIKQRDELPSTFNLETLGVGASEKEGEEAEQGKKSSPGSQFISDLFRLSPEKPSVQSKPAPAPATPAPASSVGTLTLDFGEEPVDEGKGKKKGSRP